MPLFAWIALPFLELYHQLFGVSFWPNMKYTPSILLMSTISLVMAASSDNPTMPACMVHPFKSPCLNQTDNRPKIDDVYDLLLIQSRRQ